MLFNSWYYQLRIIPESIALVALATALLKEKFSFKQISLAGFLIGSIGFVINLISFKYFGVQMILGIMIFILTLYLFLKINMLKSAIASLLSFIILTLLEFFALLIQMKMYGLTEESMANIEDSTRFIFSVPPLLAVIIIACIMQIWLYIPRKKAKV